LCTDRPSPRRRRLQGELAASILGLPIPHIRQFGPAASSVIMGEGTSDDVSFENLDEALTVPDTQLRLFGKPGLDGTRRLGVCVARGKTVEEAREKANKSAQAVKLIYN